MDKLVACQTCGLVQEAGEVPKDSVIQCARCHFQVFYRRDHSRMRTLAFSLAVLILYFPSNYYPIITADYQGQHVQTTVLQGIRSLFERQQYFIGSLLFWENWSPAIPLHSVPETMTNNTSSPDFSSM
jgi:paraquat-inducible protein A